MLDPSTESKAELFIVADQLRTVRKKFAPMICASGRFERVKTAGATLSNLTIAENDPSLLFYTRKSGSSVSQVSLILKFY